MTLPSPAPGKAAYLPAFLGLERVHLQCLRADNSFSELSENNTHHPFRILPATSTQKNTLYTIANATPAILIGPQEGFRSHTCWSDLTKVL